MAKKLFRSKDKMIAGVAAGIAEYFQIDPTIVRIIWVVVSLFTAGYFVLVYLFCLLIIPKK